MIIKEKVSNDQQTDQGYLGNNRAKDVKVLSDESIIQRWNRGVILIKWPSQGINATTSKTGDEEAC